MEQLICRPALHMFEHCTEFADQFCLGEKDLVFTNDYIYEPCFGGLKLPVHTIYQERYGAGEPTVRWWMRSSKAFEIWILNGLLRLAEAR